MSVSMSVSIEIDVDMLSVSVKFNVQSRGQLLSHYNADNAEDISEVAPYPCTFRRPTFPSQNPCHDH